MPNPWDVGSARLLASCGFEALATTSAGFAWSIGKPDQAVSRDELVAHVAKLTAATSLPLNVDSERCYPDDPGGVAETVGLLAEAGAAGFSIEDYDPATGRIDDVERAAERVAVAAEAAHRQPEPLVLTGRAENHIRGVDDLDDTIARLIAYREAGADVVYAPGLVDLDQIAAVVKAVGVAGQRPRAAARARRSPSSPRSACAGCRPAARWRAQRTARARRGAGAAGRRHLALCRRRRFGRGAGSRPGAAVVLGPLSRCALERDRQRAPELLLDEVDQHLEHALSGHPGRVEEGLNPQPLDRRGQSVDHVVHRRSGSEDALRRSRGDCFAEWLLPLPVDHLVLAPELLVAEADRTKLDPEKLKPVVVLEDAEAKQHRHPLTGSDAPALLLPSRG